MTVKHREKWTNRTNVFCIDWDDSSVSAKKIFIAMCGGITELEIFIAITELEIFIAMDGWMDRTSKNIAACYATSRCKTSRSDGKRAAKGNKYS